MLLLKLSLVPSLIVIITLIGRYWGPKYAGWFAGFPVVAGPILIFLCVEKGEEFAASSALATLLGVLASVSFSLTYCWCSLKCNWLVSVLFGWCAYFIAVFCLQFGAAINSYAALAIVWSLLTIAYRFFPTSSEKISLKKISRTELPVRMIAGAVLVMLITFFANLLGPKLSGFLAIFPVLGSVLAVFSHRQGGPYYSAKMLQGMVLGFYAFATFCFVSGALLIPLGAFQAFFAAYLAASLVQFLTTRVVRKK